MTTLNQVLERYVKRQKNRISPDGIFCKRHSIQLEKSVKKRVQNVNTRIGKAESKNYQGPEMNHVGGGNYNYHYVVIADDGSGEMVLDPFLPQIDLAPIPLNDYFSSAYHNPQDIQWGTPQL